jgi:hypothetical protein
MRRFATRSHPEWRTQQWAYDRDSPVGRLDKALDQATKKGWTIANMKRDWNTVYPN